MARARDSAKRGAILLAAKRLFARQGFHKTSVSDLRRETGLPVGTIYTYFDSKDAIMAAIIDEGWQEFYQGVMAGFMAQPDQEKRIDLLIQVFFRDLVRDTDLIAILLTEAVELTKIDEKLDLIMQLVLRLNPPPLPQNLRVAVVIYFLGFLNAARLSKTGHIGISLSELQGYMHQLIAQNLGASAPDPLPDADGQNS